MEDELAGFKGSVDKRPAIARRTPWLELSLESNWTISYLFSLGGGGGESHSPADWAATGMPSSFISSVNGVGSLGGWPMMSWYGVNPLGRLRLLQAQPIFDRQKWASSWIGSGFAWFTFRKLCFRKSVALSIRPFR